jgi:hypothetical protein
MKTSRNIYSNDNRLLSPLEAQLANVVAILGPYESVLRNVMGYILGQRTPI